jgi:hypothetical protein
LIDPAWRARRNDLRNWPKDRSRRQGPTERQIGSGYGKGRPARRLFSFSRLSFRQFVPRQFVSRQFVSRQFVSRQFVPRQFVSRQFVSRLVVFRPCRLVRMECSKEVLPPVARLAATTRPAGPPGPRGSPGWGGRRPGARRCRGPAWFSGPSPSPWSGPPSEPASSSPSSSLSPSFSPPLRGRRLSCFSRRSCSPPRTCRHGPPRPVVVGSAAARMIGVVDVASAGPRQAAGAGVGRPRKNKPPRFPGPAPVVRARRRSRRARPSLPSPRGFAEAGDAAGRGLRRPGGLFPKDRPSSRRPRLRRSIYPRRRRRPPSRLSESSRTVRKRVRGALKRRSRRRRQKSPPGGGRRRRQYSPARNAPVGRQAADITSTVRGETAVRQSQARRRGVHTPPPPGLPETPPRPGNLTKGDVRRLARGRGRKTKKPTGAAVRTTAPAPAPATATTS